MTVEHAAGYLAALGSAEDTEEILRWINVALPKTVDDAEQHVLAALAARARGERFAYAQYRRRHRPSSPARPRSTTCPRPLRTLAIGHTWLGRRWWRTGHNTESKLLLLTYAFDDLGAARVVWHTDIRNTRSQEAIARLGATREGVLRKHRIRRDGSWRDTVQYAMTDDDWPAVRDRLTARLAQRRLSCRDRSVVPAGRLEA